MATPETRKVSQRGALAAVDAVSSDLVGIARQSNTTSYKMLLSELAAYIRGLSTSFSAGTITATAVNATTFTGALVGNASTATSAATLTTARTIWGQSFNGSANVTGALTGVTGITMSSGTAQLQAVTGTSGTFTAAVTGTSLTASAGLLSVQGAASATFVMDAASADCTIHYRLNGVEKWYVGRGITAAASYQVYDAVNAALAMSIAPGAKPASTFYGQVTVGDHTASTNGDLVLDGASGSGFGAVLRFWRGGSVTGYIGNDSAINGGTSSDIDVFAGAGNAVRIYANNGLVTTFASAGATFVVPVVLNGSNLIVGSDGVGRLVVGNMATTNSNDRNICITNSTAPTGNPGSGGFIWVESGALKYRGSSGTVTTLAVA